ncbi:putative metallophosphoesterase At3g03305 isoform X2 [Helianthus annuus]|uniref:Putative calcineurin-like metallo-phosphoesterase superfamily protein n=1 Tax=Helianthus annuus TaxID=4232 RepID=A0A251THI0_HELAN|nr:putative metallophosphoesterase At3g03305 isoform X2 [Helianthus annuus]
MKKFKVKNTGLLPNSLKIISSCIRTVSTNASTVVRSAGASVAASIAASADDHRDQVSRVNPLKNYMDMKVWILLLLLCCNCSCSGSSRQVIKGENDVVWIVQLSDLHFSVHHPERASDFQESVTRTLSMLNPSLVLITGDLTDGKSKDHLTMKQNEQEWVEYQKTMENVITKSGLDRSIFYDLRGNHDNFGLPTAFDFFSNYSITAQLGRSQSVNTVTLQTSTRNVVFVSFDTTMSTGLRGPTNLFGHPTDQLLTDLNSHLSQWDSTSSTKITFGHFPLSFSAPTRSKNNLQQIFLNQSVTAYLCGHLHSRFGKNLKRRHQETDSSNLIQLNMHPKGTSKKVNDFWELEMGDWRKSRAIRLLAIDKGRVSFLDTDLKTGSKEILILPTYPLDSRYMLNKYKFESTEDTSHIRALVFSSAIIASVKVKIYDSSRHDMVVLEASMSKNDNLYTAPWNSEAFVDPSPSRYWLEIQAVDNNGVTVSTELMPFSLNGLRADLSWTWKEFFVMGCQWAELYYPIFWSFYLFVFTTLILPKIIISVSKKHYTYKYFKANKGVINGLTWVFAELDSIPFLWNLMLAYLLYLILCPWISGEVFSKGGHGDRGYMTYKGWVVNFDDLKSLEFIGFPDIMVIVIPHIYFVVLPAVVIIGALAAERAVYQDHVCSLSGKKRDDDGESRSKDHNVSGWMLRKWARGILVIFSLAVCWKHFKNCWALMKAYEMNPLVHFPFYSFSIPLLLAYAFLQGKKTITPFAC